MTCLAEASWTQRTTLALDSPYFLSTMVRDSRQPVSDQRSMIHVKRRAPKTATFKLCSPHACPYPLHNERALQPGDGGNYYNDGSP
jgi:hypothetical protein